MVTNSPQVLEELSQEYDHQEQPIIDLGLKPLWQDETEITPVNKKNKEKTEAFVIPFLH